jgi:hypothetical protein
MPNIVDDLRLLESGARWADSAAADVLERAADEIERLRLTCTTLNSEVCQRLGKALSYPWFKDDQENFLGATEENGVCTGEHVAESIAAEAATRIERLEAQLAWWDNASREMYEALNKAEAERDAAVMDADMQAREAGNMEHNARVLMAERDRLREALQLVMAYRRGEGRFRFDQMAQDQRDNALMDAWQEVEEMIRAALKETGHE